LIQRIYAHATAEGWLADGSVCLDPFAGVALGARYALPYGVHWIGIELEQPFCDIGAGCDCTGITPADWRRFAGRWTKARYLDGRHWCPACMQAVSQVTGERPATRRTFRTASGSTTRTVPYSPLPLPDRHDGVRPHRPAQARSLWDVPVVSYGRSSGVVPSSRPHHYEGNLERWARLGTGTGRLIQGDSKGLRAIVMEEVGLCASSPPYNLPMSQDHNGSKGGTRGTIPSERGAFVQYGTTPGQLEGLPPGQVEVVLEAALGPQMDLAVGSPPFGDSDARKGGSDLYTRKELQRGRSPQSASFAGHAVTQPYGTDPAQLANLPAGQLDAAVGSPPYEGSNQRYTETDGCITRLTQAGKARADHGFLRNTHSYSRDYGTHPDQLGNTQGTTFWEAARVIIEQVYSILRPGAACIWVVKNYVRDGKVVQFTEDWARLNMAVGFEWLHHHQALLVEAHGTQETLFGGTENMRTERKGFFRRLAEKKGSPRIDAEDVLCFRKPAGPAPETGVQVVCCVGSPPYSSRTVHDGNGIDWTKAASPTGGRLTPGREIGSYGTTPGQLGALPAGSLGCALGSPPYAGTTIAHCEGTMSGGPGGRTASALTNVSGNIKQVGCGSTCGNLGNLPEGRHP